MRLEKSTELEAVCFRPAIVRMTNQVPPLHAVSFLDEDRKRKFGAGNEARTRDLNLGKVALYQLSYSRPKQTRNCRAEPLRVKENSAQYDAKALNRPVIS
jgi:hypothetical protein